MKSFMARYRQRMEHTHGWEVELACPWCGLVAVPTFRGWTPTTAINFGERPTIFADLECPRCARDLTEPAGAALVAHFSNVSTSRRNRALLAAFVALILTFELGGAAILFLTPHRDLATVLMRIPLLLLAPLILYFNSVLSG